MSTNLLEQIFAEKMEQRFTQGFARGREEGREAGREEGVAQGIEQGVAQGIARGREEGRTDGERALLQRYLERQFGAIPPALEVRIAALDAEGLAALFDRALTAEAIETL